MRSQDLVLLLLFAAACAQEHEPAPDPATPTPPEIPSPPVTPDPFALPVTPTDRLAPRFAQAEAGGAWRFVHFVDRRLQEPCRLTPDDNAGPNAMRCLPMGEGRLWYGDEACTQRVVRSAEGEGDWVTALDWNTRMRVVRLGAPLSRPPSVYFEARGSCAEDPDPQVDGTFHAVAEELPLEALATGTLETEPMNRSLDVVLFRTPEGSRYRYDLIDHLSGERCDPEQTESGARCAPAGSWIEDEGYRDVDCLGFAAAFYSDPKFAFVRELDEYYRFELQPDDASIGFLMPDGSCGIAGPERRDNRRYYLGWPHPRSAWPQIGFARPGGPRLFAPQFPLQEGEIADVGLYRAWGLARFEDTERNFTCTPAFVGDAQRFASETLRCVPDWSGTLGWGYIYSDPACTIPALGVPDGSEPPRYSAIGNGDAPAAMGLLPVVQVLEVGAELSPSELFHRYPEGCRASAPSYGRFFRAGRVLEESELATLRFVGGI
ncbi:MAG: hypothetical protein IT384_00900 [Deltaproteobacteria bacterium]|nr:hypothetical protein [Deltaproteobacteria bacterium]